MREKTRDSQQPYAIVIGLDCITGLQTARILSREGVPVIGLARDAAHYCCRTKACEEIHRVDTGGEDLIAALNILRSKLSQRAVLFPCTDLSVLLISRNRRELEDSYHVMLPEPDVVEMLMDKISFYTYARSEGLPIPGTFILSGRADVLEAAKELTFPCILKPPVKTPSWEKHSRAKVYRAESAEELIRLYDRCSKWADVLMAQEWVEGTDSDLYSCNCYFNAESKPVVTFISRKIRQWPPEIGVSCLGEECRNDVVLRESLRLFEGVSYRGLGYLEMKRDARTGKQVIIEPNVGRPTGRSAIAEAGGVALLYAAYCDTAGRPLPPNLEQRYEGAKWIYLRRDIQSALYYWRRGDLSLTDWWRSLRGRKTDAVFALDDPAPFLGDLLKGIEHVASCEWRDRIRQRFSVRRGS